MLYTVLPLALVISIVLFALITTFYWIYKNYYQQVEENVYEQISIPPLPPQRIQYASVPPLPPQRIQIEDNLAYVRVELTDCIAYERSPWLPKKSPHQNLSTIHLGKDEQGEKEQNRMGVDSVINETPQPVEDIPTSEDPV